jgi:hypothetical protein
MKDITEKNFGVIIAFLLPGFLLLWLLSVSDVDLSSAGLRTLNTTDQSVGGFLTITLAALAVGMVISAVRWAIIDTFLRFFWRKWGTPLAKLPSFSQLKEKDAFLVFQGIIENHYRYYQYYSNTLIAIAAAATAHLLYGKEKEPLQIWATIIILGLFLLAASADCIQKYHTRAAELVE